MKDLKIKIHNWDFVVSNEYNVGLLCDFDRPCPDTIKKNYKTSVKFKKVSLDAKYTSGITNNLNNKKTTRIPVWNIGPKSDINIKEIFLFSSLIF